MQGFKLGIRPEVKPQILVAALREGMLRLAAREADGAIINWFAHKYGYRNFEVGDTSRNFLPVDFLMMGESYHNNHHKSGSNANFGGIRWHEIDPTYQIIRLLDKIGVIHLIERNKTNQAKIQPA